MPLKPTPETLQVTEVGPELSLCGVGDRIIKLGFIQVNIYCAAFYVDAEAAAESLGAAFSSHSLDDLLGDGDFFPALVRGPYTKAIRLTFCRALPKNKLAPGFDGTLIPRLAPESAEDGRTFVQGMIPNAGYQDDDVLLLVFHAGGSLLEARYIAKGTAEPESLVQVKSGDAGGVWEGMQNLYFDASTEMPAVRQGFVGKLPSLLSCQMGKQQAAAARQEAEEGGRASADGGQKPAMQRLDTAAITEAAALQVAGSHAAHKEQQRNWREVSGRKNGGDGYRFGDASRSFFNKAVRKGSALRGRVGSAVARPGTIQEEDESKMSILGASLTTASTTQSPSESREPSTATSESTSESRSASNSVIDELRQEVEKLKARCAASECRAKEAEARHAASRTSLLVLGVALGLALSLAVAYLLPGAQTVVSVALLVGSAAFTACTGFGGLRLQGAVAGRSPALSDYEAPLLDQASLSGWLAVEAVPPEACI